MKQKTVKKSIKSFAATFFACLATVLFSSTLALSATYYVDASGGNDANNGTSEITAWKTLTKVNGFAFVAGDIIRFKRDQVWNGQLVISRAGTAASVITFTTYGTGNKPLINAGGTLRDAIYVAVSHIVVDGFAATNYDGANIFDGAEARRTGIRVGQFGLTLSNVKILNNEVYFVEGCSNHSNVGSPRGTSLPPAENNQYQNGAIYADPSIITGLTIEKNYVHDCTNTGILASIYESSSNVIIRSNSIYNVGSDGVQIWNSQNALIELNSVIKPGNNSGPAPRGAGVLGFNGLAVCGMWSFQCNSPVFQYNYCEGTKVITYDGQAWDFDIGTTGSAVYQYNYSRDNEGGFNLAGLSAQDAAFVFRYNISFNDGSKQGQGEGFFNGACQFNNNVFYRNDGKEFHFDNFIKCTGTFKNNIFYTNSSIANTYVADGRVFNNNDFFGHTANSPGTSPIFSNPSFVDVNGATKVPPGVILNSPADLRSYVTGFKLSSGSSPCVNTGTTIASNGGLDFWGNTLYNGAPDIGANEFTGTSIPVAGVSVSPTAPSPITVGSTVSLTATVTPSNATNPGVTWLTSNPLVATVNTSGVVTGVAAGTANITARSNDGTNITSSPSVVTVTSSSTLPTPIIKLQLNENTGTSVANTGSGAGTFSRTTPTPAWSTNVPASVGQASSVDFGTTTGNYVVESSAALPALQNLSAFTITCWVNCRSSSIGSGGNRLVSWINNGGNGADLVYRTDGSVALSVNEWPDLVTGSSASKVTTSASAPASNWVFAAVTYNGTQVQYYFGNNTTNATLDVTRAYNKGVAGSNISRLAIGHFNVATRSAALDRMFRGLIDDVQVFGSVLSAAQIVQVQTGGGGGTNSISITNTSPIANDQTFNIASVSTTDWVMPNVDEKSGGTAISIAAVNDWQQADLPNFTYNNGTTFTGNQTRKSFYRYDQPTASIAVPAGSGTLYLWLGSGSTTDATVTVAMGSVTTGAVLWGGRQQFTLSYNASTASTINVSMTRGSNVNVGIFAIGLAASGGGSGGQSASSEINGEMNEEIVSVFPNPVKDNTLNIRIYSDKESEAKINMFSPTSQEVADLQWSLVKGENNFEMRVDHLKRGLHLLIINRGNERIVKKVIIDE